MCLAEGAEGGLASFIADGEWRMSGAAACFRASERSRGSTAFSPPVSFLIAQNGERQERGGRKGSLAEAANSEEKGEDDEFAIR